MGKDTSSSVWIATAFAFAYLLVMYVPLGYDLLNLSSYKAAENEGQLVIQEYTAPVDELIKQDCSASGGCTTGEIFDRLQDKKLISADYVAQMERASTLSLLEFVVRSAGFAIPTVLMIFLVARFTSGSTGGVLLVVIFMMSLALFPWVSGLPHTNGKFYYIFGSIFSVLLATASGMRVVRAPSFPDTLDQALRNDALSAVHRKWTRILLFSLTVMVVFVGTTSLTLWDYMNVVFGSAFSFYPFVGVLFGMATLAIVFYVGIFQQILRIQAEIETQMGAV